MLAETAIYMLVISVWAIWVEKVPQMTAGPINLTATWLLTVKARLPVTTDKLEIPVKVLSDGLPSPLYTTSVALEPPPSTSGSLLLPVMVTVPVTMQQSHMTLIVAHGGNLSRAGNILYVVLNRINFLSFTVGSDTARRRSFPSQYAVEVQGGVDADGGGGLGAQGADKMVAPFMAANFVMNQCLRAEGSAMLSMIGMGFGGILNCFLDPLFIFWLDMGVAGASIATAISKLVSFAILIFRAEGHGGEKGDGEDPAGPLLLPGAQQPGDVAGRAHGQHGTGHHDDLVQEFL